MNLKKGMPKIALTVTLCLLSLTAEASISRKDQATLAEAYAMFQRGAYNQAIEKARTITSTDKETQGTIAYFIATAHAKVQAYDKAVPFFRRALASGYKPESIHYDLGQALYASQQLKEAEAEFKKSIVAKYKMAASAYYVGFIRQTLEDLDAAKDFYQRIQKLNSDPDKVKQPALYQIAEMEFQKLENEKNKELRIRKIRNQVLPLFQAASDFESGTPTHEQAEAKITQLEAELAAHVERMRNGLPIPQKPYTLHLSQGFGYDSNVITQADQALVQVSNKDSFFIKPSLLAKYQFNWRRTFSFIPELNLSYQRYLRREQPRVYQNDNATIAPALRTKYEHMSGGQPASFLFDVEFNLMVRDYQQMHQLPFYSRYWNVTVGERVKWFNTGTTTLKVGVKLFESYTPDRNSYSPTVSLQQNVKIFDRWDLSNTLSVDYLRARNDINDEKNYKLRQSVALTKLIEQIDVTPAVSLTVKDTGKQDPVRGTEALLNPTLTLNRDFWKNFDGELLYGYSMNWSKDKQNYEYSKHEITTTVTYKF